ncbi:F-box SKIP23-like protein (DUF295) [Rhynchospora pubera]|uniref:F-box SKIP23-like protein (DUF295) n=1 Tax=Rhynchospora pubera TaxID=906938 RepID=A0AAV8H711_9POAL|nr:F-box SKIP23-like protein (DUF295) [Rhynchospora pubera]
MDWSQLPPDLLYFISKKLPDLSDFVRFRAVCKRWCSAAPVSDPPRQLPWVVTARYGLPSAVRFYSLSTGKYYSRIFNEVEGKQLLGSSHGYMLAFDPNSRRLSLLNPLTIKEIHLPVPPTDSDWHRPLYIGPDPVQSGDDVVICWSSSDDDVLTVGLCRPGDQEWKKIQISGGVNGQTYYNGMCFVNESKTLATKVIDTKTGTTLSTIPPLICTTTGNPRGLYYLIMSSGELLGVYGGKWTCQFIGDYEFEVYRLDSENKVPQWIRIDSIGDRVLFLDDTVGFCLSTTDLKGFKGDCIYFIASLYDMAGFSDYPLCRYDMKNRIAEAVVPGPYGDMSSWFFPCIS